MFIKSHVNKSIWGFIIKCTKDKDLMKPTKEQFVGSDKALVSTLIKRLWSMKHDMCENVCEYITEIRDTAAELKALKVEISYSFLVHFILNSFLFNMNLSKFRMTFRRIKGKSMNFWPCAFKRKSDWNKRKSANLVSHGKEMLRNDPLEGKSV